jgi:hypothetical protein
MVSAVGSGRWSSANASKGQRSIVGVTASVPGALTTSACGSSQENRFALRSVFASQKLADTSSMRANAAYFLA